MKRPFFHALICAACLMAARVNADDAALEQRLNDVYTQLRHTLTPAEKEALKQEELHWLNERDRFLRGDPRRTTLTEERIRVLQTWLSGAAPQQQTTSASVSPDEQYAVTARPSSNGWASAGAARLRTDGIDVTMSFQEPTKFVFRLGRFADLTLETRQGGERATYESGNKQGSETLFDLPVTLTAPMTWETRKGTRFHLQKLDHPVINDANRKTNSGDWKVTVSGEGDEYNSIKRDLGEPSFGDAGKTEYYGEIDLEATGK